MRVVLVGMNNPHSMRAEHALYPAPDGVAGHRLWRMMCDATDGPKGGLSRSEYVKIFDRVNLVRGDWNRSLASVEAATMLRKLRYDERRVVLLGAEVVGAFAKAGADLRDEPQFDWSCPGPSRLGRWAHLPHPSGRSRAWNEASVRAQAKDFFRELVVMARKQHEDKP